MVACGGGGGGSAALEAAALQGVVFEVDGQTADRSGVEVRVLETGQLATTGADGRFYFSRVPTGTVTLGFGPSLAALAQTGPGGGHGSDDPPGDDRGGASGSDDEDDQGNPQVGGVAGGDTVEVRAAVEGGQVTELSVVSSDRVRAEARLVRDAAAGDPDVQGKVKVESRLDRERFAIEAERLDAGTVVEFFLDDPADAAGFISIGAAAAIAGGEAQIERSTNDGDPLPLDALGAKDLAGFLVEVRLTSGDLLLTGEVPALPDPNVTAGSPGATDRSRGRAFLTALAAGVEGTVEIRQREDAQRLKMEVEHLAPGTAVAFWIQDATGTFVRIAGAVADAMGEAEISTQDGLSLPLGAADVAALVGLSVQVTRDDGSGEVLLLGTVPSLVAD
jgi:hypothetical protein